MEDLLLEIESLYSTVVWRTRNELNLPVNPQINNEYDIYSVVSDVIDLDFSVINGGFNGEIKKV